MGTLSKLCHHNLHSLWIYCYWINSDTWKDTNTFVYVSDIAHSWHFLFIYLFFETWSPYITRAGLSLPRPGITGMYFHALLVHFKPQIQVSQDYILILVPNGRIIFPLIMELISNYGTGEMAQWSRGPGFNSQHTWGMQCFVCPLQAL